MKFDGTYFSNLCDIVLKTFVEAFENLTIKDINMYQLGYNKAIDDFVEACDNQFVAMYGQRYIDMRNIKEIAEQLKVGGENEMQE